MIIEVLLTKVSAIEFWVKITLNDSIVLATCKALPPALLIAYVISSTKNNNNNLDWKRKPRTNAHKKNAS